jgi:hypothetical protein
VISIGNLNKNKQKATRIHVVGKTFGGKKTWSWKYIPSEIIIFCHNIYGVFVF